MPITVNYQPNANLLGSAAYDIGLAETLRRKQEEQQAQQLRDASLREQQRQFDITNQRQYDQIGEGQYQFDVEQGFRGQQFGEGQRQFDAGLGLKQQQLEGDRENDAFNRQIAEHRDRLARYGIMQQAAGQQAREAGNLAEVDLRGQYGLAELQMQHQALMQREAQNDQSQAGLLWQQQAAKQMQADWMNIQKVLPKLDPDERADLLSQFTQRWESANVPMPVEIPQPKLPEWQDPDAQWAKAQEQQAKDAEQGYYYHLVPDQKNGGMPSIMRGSPAFPQTPAGMQAQHEFELKKAEVTSQHKAIETEVKARDKEHDTFIKTLDAEQKQAQAEDKHIQDMRHADEQHRIALRQQIAKLELTIAKEEIPRDDGREAPNLKAVKAHVKELKKQLEQPKEADAFDEMTPSTTPQPSANRPVWETMPRSDVYIGDTDISSPSVPGQQWYVPSAGLVKRIEGGVIATYRAVSSPAEAAKLPKGTPVILPDGRAGVVK